LHDNSVQSYYVFKKDLLRETPCIVKAALRLLRVMTGR
jgi:hypothetical protein